MRRAARLIPLTTIVVLGLITAACLGRLPNDAPTRQIVLSLAGSTDLPLHESRSHWLLRDLPRWCGASEARWGGNAEDRAIVTARAVRFRDAGAAARGWERLTPEYLGTIFRDRILDGPWQVEVMAPLPGDEWRPIEYGVRMPPDEHGAAFIGQYVAVRSGSAVILTESLGLGPEELHSTVARLVSAAEAAQGGC